jgi:hypothetical protein
MLNNVLELMVPHRRERERWGRELDGGVERNRVLNKWK